MRCDLNKETRRKSFELAFEAMNKFSVEKDISEYIKTIFDREFNPTWQCIVGNLFFWFINLFI